MRNIRQLITEDKETKAQDKVRKEIEKYEDKVRVRGVFNTIRECLPSIRLPFYDIVNQKGTYKYGPGIVRWWYNTDKVMVSDDHYNVNYLVELIAENHNDEYDGDFNGEHWMDLLKKYASEIKARKKAQRETASQGEYIKNSRYTIIPMRNHTDCKDFARYTNWCITYDTPAHYNGYTNYGKGKFYICLRDDYKTIEEKKGINAPLDDYGLSMLAICVDEEGDYKTCTTRWNHDIRWKGEDDKALNVKEIEELLGVNFYKTFLPRTAEEMENSSPESSIRSQLDRLAVSRFSGGMPVNIGEVEHDDRNVYFLYDSEYQLFESEDDRITKSWVFEDEISEDALETINNFAYGYLTWPIGNSKIVIIEQETGDIIWEGWKAYETQTQSGDEDVWILVDNDGCARCLNTTEGQGPLITPQIKKTIYAADGNLFGITHKTGRSISKEHNVYNINSGTVLVGGMMENPFEEVKHLFGYKDAMSYQYVFCHYADEYVVIARLNDDENNPFEYIEVPGCDIIEANYEFLAKESDETTIIPVLLDKDGKEFWALLTLHKNGVEHSDGYLVLSPENETPFERPIAKINRPHTDKRSRVRSRSLTYRVTYADGEEVQIDAISGTYL